MHSVRCYFDSRPSAALEVFALNENSPIIYSAAENSKNIIEPVHEREANIGEEQRWHLSDQEVAGIGVY